MMPQQSLVEAAGTVDAVGDEHDAFPAQDDLQGVKPAPVRRGGIFLHRLYRPGSLGRLTHSAFRP
jgi:hypothetical protein